MAEPPSTPVPRPRTIRNSASFDQANQKPKPIPKRRTTVSGAEILVKQQQAENETLMRSHTLGKITTTSTTSVSEDDSTSITHTPVTNKKKTPTPTKTKKKNGKTNNSCGEEEVLEEKVITPLKATPLMDEDENERNEIHSLKRRISYLQQDKNQLQNEVKNKKNIESKLDQERERTDKLCKELKNERDYIKGKNDEINKQ